MKEKSEIFNSFYANQCSLIPNNGILPSELKLFTEHTLTSCDFSETDSLQIINTQDSNKAHDLDMINVASLCGKSICRPANKIFKLCLNTGKFPLEWKKGNVIPIHKNNVKRNVENYCPLSLLPICGKTFEFLIYNVMYNFLSENNLSPNQSGFTSGDSCINQQLSNHEILNEFNKVHEVRWRFLDVSKAFDKVWHDGFIFKPH